MIAAIDPYSTNANNLSRLPSEQVRGLSNFVFSKVHPSAVAQTKVDILEGAQSGRMSGVAYSEPPSSVSLKPHQEFLVRLLIGGDLSYSFVWEYRKRAGATELHGWDEEFLYLLSHEMAHIMQFRRDWGFGYSYHYEVEAEIFAQKTLKEYRDWTRMVQQMPSLIGA